MATSAPQRKFCHSIEDLPDGTFITDDELTAYLVLNHQLLALESIRI